MLAGLFVCVCPCVSRACVLVVFSYSELVFVCMIVGCCCCRSKKTIYCLIIWERVHSQVNFKDVSVLDAPPPSTWTPDKEGGNKVSAAERVCKLLTANAPSADHAVNFVDTLSDDDA
jgi:hypothetical protein